MTAGLLTLIGQVIAPVVVDPDHLLDRYPDLAEAKVEPVAWFAQHRHREPVRTPSPTGGTVISFFTPFVILMVHFARCDRQNLLDCLRRRILDLSCTDRTVQHGVALRIARLVGDRLRRSPERLGALHAGGLGWTI